MRKLRWEEKMMSLYPLVIVLKAEGAYLSLYPVPKDTWGLSLGPLSQKEDMKLVYHFHIPTFQCFKKMAAVLIFIHLETERDQGCLLLPVLPLSRASWSNFGGLAWYEKESEPGATLKHNLYVPHSTLLSTTFLITLVCDDCFINNRHS